VSLATLIIAFASRLHFFVGDLTNLCQFLFNTEEDTMPRSASLDDATQPIIETIEYADQVLIYSIYKPIEWKL